MLWLREAQSLYSELVDFDAWLVGHRDEYAGLEWRELACNAEIYKHYLIYHPRIFVPEHPPLFVFIFLSRNSAESCRYHA